MFCILLIQYFFLAVQFLLIICHLPVCFTFIVLLRLEVQGE